MKKDFSKRILVGITGLTDKHWQDKLEEVKKFKLTTVTLFLERFTKTQRRRIYKALLNSNIKHIPLVHIRNDMSKDELAFLVKNFSSKCLTIHESSFRYMKKWKGFHKRLYLEMNYNSKVPKNVNVRKIGGFCIDLSHFKVAEEKWSTEFEYIIQRRKIKKYFACNHINGYSYKKNKDIHKVKSLKEFNYLKTLPSFVFGDLIGMETDNSIAEQLKFKKHIVNFLNKIHKR